MGIATDQRGAMTRWPILLLLVGQLTTCNADITVKSACPGQSLKLTCPLATQRLVIRNASYYGPEETCPPPAVRHCEHPDPVGGLARTCFGKRQCIIKGQDMAEVFSESNYCPGVPLYAKVEYDCVEENAVKSICDTEPITWPPHGYVISENYPDKYSNGRACDRVVKGRKGQKVVISMFDLQMEFSAHARQCYDYVVFRQVGNGQMTRTYCGSQLNAADHGFMYSLNENDEVTVVFESSVKNRFRGFLFEYRVEGCPTAEVPAPPVNGRIQAFNTSDFVLYECHAGYQSISSSNQRVNCSLDGKWNGDPGYCVPKTPVPTEPRKSTTAQVIIREETQPSTSLRPTLPESTIPGNSETLTTHPPTTIGTTPRTVPTVIMVNTVATEVMVPVWAMEPLRPYTSSELASTTLSGSMEPTFEAAAVSPGLDVPIIGAISGGLVLLFLLAIILTVIIVYRIRNKTSIKRNHRKTADGLSSLRPSAHACVSIPNTYAGVGYPTTNSAYVSAHLKHIPPNSITRISSKQGRSNISDSISYESEIYERAAIESLKGSADPILTQSDTSFDCVDVSNAQSKLNASSVLTINPAEGYTNPGATIYSQDETYIGHEPGAGHDRGPIESDLIYPVARPSLETIREEHEAECSFPDQQCDVTPEESLPGFIFDREEADGESLGHTMVPECDVDDISVRTVSSEVKAKVGKRRIRTRPISMGEADQPESKRRFDKVEYALFKDDVTGNLDNFLEHRRVSV